MLGPFIENSEGKSGEFVIIIFVPYIDSDYAFNKNVTENKDLDVLYDQLIMLQKK